MDSGVGMIKIIEMFSGIGAQVAALKRLGLEYEVVGISEIDKYAIQSYEAINGPTYNYGDITKIESLDYADLWTFSSPCQDFSVAGRQKGLRDENGELTRSGLLLHVERLLVKAIKKDKQPKYLLLENVKNLVGKKFKPDFDSWLDRLNELGYNNYWHVLNAKDYGVPQNRERVFCVSIRQDCDNRGYGFPLPIPLQKRLKDLLETNVDEKYYLSDKIIEGFFKKMDRGGNGFSSKINIRNPEGEASTLTARMHKMGMTDNYIQEPLIFGGMQANQSVKTDGVCTCLTSSMGTGGGYVPMVTEPVICASRGRNPENPSDGTVGAPTEQRLEINESGYSNTLTSVQKDNYVLEPKVINPLKDKTPYGWHFEQEVYDENGVARAVKAGGSSGNIPKVIQVGNIVETDSFGGNPQCGKVYSADGCSPTLNTMQGGGREPKIVNNYRIRKLTPRECWRLMGFTDDEFDKAQQSGVSNTQLYKQAGNSIVVDVLSAIFENLFLKEEQ